MNRKFATCVYNMIFAIKTIERVTLIRIFVIIFFGKISSMRTTSSFNTFIISQNNLLKNFLTGSSERLNETHV